MKSPQVSAARIAGVFQGRWLKGYVQGKLSTDPLFNQALQEVQQYQGGIIDLGCGLALFALWLREHGMMLSYRGCDLVAWKIKAAEAAMQKLGHTNIVLEIAEMTEFSLEDAAVVCVFDVLHYLSADVQHQLVTRLAMAARGGAIVLIRTGVKGCGWRSFLTLIQEFWIKITGWIQGGSVTLPDLKNLIELFQSQGCLVESRPLWGKTPFSNYWLKVSWRR